MLPDPEPVKEILEGVQIKSLSVEKPAATEGLMVMVLVFSAVELSYTAINLMVYVPG